MIIHEKAKKIIPFSDLNNVYIVADFDRTITTGNSKTSWSILANSDLVPDSYIKERNDLFNYYRPIEIDETIDSNKKNILVKEWFQKHIELFVKYKMTEEIFKIAAINLSMLDFRPGAKEFLEFLHKNSIPLIIISAGIGNFIEEFFNANNCYFNNIYVSSNKIIFKNGIAVGVEDNIIHSLNKNEISLPSCITKNLKNKSQVILLGDQLSDLNMVNKDSHHFVLSVGFLADDYPKNQIDDFKSKFDIICEQDDNYFNLKNILF